MTLDRIFGPYGTRLESIGREIGQLQLADPITILNGEACRDAVTSVARGYLQHGATVGTVNAFGLRNRLHVAGDEPVFSAALDAHHQALQIAISEQGRRTRNRTRIVISLGPQADCYQPEQAPNRQEARDFHERQAAEASRLQPDAAWFETINTSEEAIGIALAAKAHNVPCVISFVLNKDGDLLSGEPLREVIRSIDNATGNYPIGYSLNCCPIEALEPALKSLGRLQHRVIGAYPNASSKTPDELNGSTQLHRDNDRHQTAQILRQMARQFNLRIIGGCCGFDETDIHLLSQ